LRNEANTASEKPDVGVEAVAVVIAGIALEGSQGVSSLFPIR
jgi:hypothetical protein